MAKVNEVMMGIMEQGAPVLVGELRGTAKEAQLCKVTLEVGKYPAVKSIVLTVGERGGEVAMGKKIADIPRGSVVSAVLTGYRIERGVIAGSAHEIMVL